MNIYQIAKKTGVSPTSVSRVINGKQHVSDELRERVEAVIKESGYVPNFFARSLNKKDTKTVGILCPVISDINHSRQVASLERQLREQGFDIILCSMEHNYEPKDNYLSVLVQKQVEAIFIIGSSVKDAKYQQALIEISNKIPVIVINGFINGPSIFNVYCKEKEMCCNLVNELCFAGYSKVLYIYDSVTFTGQQKKKGYELGMQRCGLKANIRTLQIQEEISMTDIEKSTMMILEHVDKLDVKPDSIITADDILAVPTQKAFKKLGIQAPIIGWSNTMYAQVASPTITSVEMNMDKMSEIAVAMLMNVLSGKPAPQKVGVPASLVIRETFIPAMG